jgi:hypothetical protein
MKRIAAALCAMVLAMTGAMAQDPPDPLREGFSDPPATARPRVWWHWMNGNVTEAGIRKDIDWMTRVGLGGLQNFDAALATPQVVDRRLADSSWRSPRRRAGARPAARGCRLPTA